MDQDKFWKTIQTAIDQCVTTKKSYLELLADELAKLSLEEIVLWDIYFEAYIDFASKGKVWAGGFILNKGECDDDQFDAFCAWLISMGREYYFSILADVDTLAKLNVAHPAAYVAKFEELIYLAKEVFVKKASIQPLVNPAKAETQFFKLLETQSLTIEELFVLKTEINYDRDINLVWNETKIERLKKTLPNLCDKYLRYLDKNAAKLQPYAVISGI